MLIFGLGDSLIELNIFVTFNSEDALASLPGRCKPNGKWSLSGSLKTEKNAGIFVVDPGLAPDQTTEKAAGSSC